MNKIQIGTQHWPAFQHFKDQPGGLWAVLDETLQHYSSSGCQIWEGLTDDDAQATELKETLQRHHLSMPSAYVGGDFHQANWRETLPEFMKAVRRAQSLGASLIVSNPNPIKWNSPEEKTDDQLKTQSEAFQKFAEELNQEGMQLAYHWHDPEFRSGAREVLHMIQHTNPSLVKICFDTHWSYRGSGNSELAMFNLLEMTFSRIVSFHIRQSIGGLFCPIFGEGDIDYHRWAELLTQRNWSGLVILEQSREFNSPRLTDFFKTQQQSVQNLRRLLKI